MAVDFWDKVIEGAGRTAEKFGEVEAGALRAAIGTNVLVGGVERLLKTDIKLQAFAKALEIVPLMGQRWAKDLKEAAETIRNLSSITQNESKVFEAFADLLTQKPGAAVKKFGDELVKAAREIQTYERDLLKLGQNSAVLEDQTRKLTIAYSTFGISNKEVQESLKGVIKGYTGAVRISAEGNKAFNESSDKLIMMASFNKKWGIEISDTMKVASYFNNTLNNGVEVSQKFSDSLTEFAMQTGQDVNEVFKSFSSNLERFAGLPTSRALESFTRLELYAKRTGQEFSKIRTNLESFDDISTGYEKIGKLNRLLMQFGSSIDPMAFMQATDEGKQKMMIEAISKVQNYGGKIGRAHV